MEKTKMLKVIADYDDNPVDVTAEVNFIWNIANKLRGTYQSDKYKDVIIPMTIIRRFECALVKTKDRTQEIAKIFGEGCPDEVLFKETGVGYFNLSDFTLKTLLDEPDNLEENFRSYISKFSGNVREILQSLEFDKQIAKMAKSDRLFTVMKSFSEIDLNPEKVDSIKMGYIFEDLIRRFSENAEAGDHYTGRDIVKLLVSLICAEGCEDLMQPGRVVKVLDQACGTGGMLSTSQNFILHMNPEADVYLYGQEINPESYAICKAEMLIRGQDADNIQLGDSLKADRFEEEKTVRFVIENPPFGTAWGGKDAPEGTEAAVIRQYESGEHYEGGLPGKGDMQLLFIQRALDKINPKDGRAAIITNGSPLFTGGTTSGESQIRRWLLEHDYIEAIVALSPDSFYNTGIGTYVNILTKNKSEKRKGKIQLIDASGICHPLRKPLGMKKNEITREDREKILELYVNFEENEHCKIFDNAEFIYREYTIMQPMKRNYMITEDRIEAAKAAGCFTSLYDENKVSELNEKLENGEKLTKKEEKVLDKYEAGKMVYDDLLKNLAGAVSDTVWNCRDGFMPVLKNLLPTVNGKPCFDNKTLLKLAGGLSQRDENALVQTDKKGNIEYDPETKDTEIVKGTDTIEEYMTREVLPHIPDAAWFFEEDAKKSTVKTGAEIPFTRYFFKYQRPEAMEALDSKIIRQELKIQNGLTKMTKKKTDEYLVPLWFSTEEGFKEIKNDDEIKFDWNDIKSCHCRLKTSVSVLALCYGLFESNFTISHLTSDRDENYNAFFYKHIYQTPDKLILSFRKLHERIISGENFEKCVFNKTINTEEVSITVYFKEKKVKLRAQTLLGLENLKELTEKILRTVLNTYKYAMLSVTEINPNGFDTKENLCLENLISDDDINTICDELTSNGCFNESYFDQTTNSYKIYGLSEFGKKLLHNLSMTPSLY